MVVGNAGGGKVIDKTRVSSVGRGAMARQARISQGVAVGGAGQIVNYEMDELRNVGFRKEEEIMKDVGVRNDATKEQR